MSVPLGCLVELAGCLVSGQLAISYCLRLFLQISAFYFPPSEQADCSIFALSVGRTTSIIKFPSQKNFLLFLPRSSSPPQKRHFPSPNIVSNERFALFTWSSYGLYSFFQASLPPGFLTVPRLRWYRIWLQLERNKWIWNELSVNFTSYTNSHEINSTKAFYRIDHCLRVLSTPPSLWLWS